MPRATTIIFLLAGLAIVGLASTLIGSTTRVTALQTSADSLSAAYDSLKKNCAPAPEQEHNGRFWMSQAVKARDNQWMLLHESEIRELQTKGLPDPVNDLRNDLKSHPEIIPIAPSPTLRWGVGPVALLSTKWAFAHYEDGHMMGNMLLEYDVLPGGKIRWTVLGAGLM